jgi:nucleoid DNA-binding protein
VEDAAAYDNLVTIVVRTTGLSHRLARALLRQLGEAVAREALLRGRRVWWPHLGVFRAYRQKARRVSLTALRDAGHVPASSPDEARVPPTRRLRFTPSRWTALIREAP